MSLDDLLTTAREHRQEPSPGRFTVGSVLGILIGSAVVGFAAYQVLLLTGYRVPYPLLCGGLAAGLLARKITAAAHGVPLPPPRIADSHRWVHESPHDHGPCGARQWAIRFEAAGDRDTFNRTVRPAIVALVDERLRLRHGVDRLREPARVEALLPEPLWRFVTEPVTRPPKPHQVELLARQIEQM